MMITESQRRCRAAVWALTVSLCAAVGCGDDDTPGPEKPRSDAGSRTAEDAAPARADASTQPSRGGKQLADGIVGQPCTSPEQCGSGSCMQTIPVVNVAYPGGYCTGSCSRDADCGAEGVCQPGILGRAGSCYLRCDEANGCEREGYRCRVVSGVGRCIAGPEPLPDGVAGSACANDEACGGSPMSCLQTLAMSPAPGGYCSVACAISEDCGAGGVCINGISIPTISSGRCLKTCASSSDCREGYMCNLFGGPGSTDGGACVPATEQADAGEP